MKYWDIEEIEPTVVKVSIKKAYWKLNLFYNDSQVLYFYRYGVGLFPLSPMKAVLFMNPPDFFNWFYSRYNPETVILNPIESYSSDRIISFPTDAVIQLNLFDGLSFSYKDDKAKQQLFKLLDIALVKQAKLLKQRYKMSSLSEF